MRGSAVRMVVAKFRGVPTPVKTVLKAGVTLVLLVVTFRMVDFGEMLGKVRGTEAAFLAAACAAVLAGGFAGGLSWLFILRVRWPVLPAGKTLGIYWSGMFFNTFLPSNIGGDVVKGYWVARDQGAAGFVVASLVLDRAVNMGVLVCMGVSAWLLYFRHFVVLSGFLAVLLFSVAFAAAAGRRCRPWVQGRMGQGGWRGKAAAFLGLLCELAGAPRLFLPVLGMAFLSQFFKILQNVAVLLAFGLAIPALAVWFIIPLFGVVSALPVSVGGLGLREMVAQGIAGPLRLDNTDMVTLSLAGYFVVVAVNMLGAVPFVLARRSNHQSARERTAK